MIRETVDPLTVEFGPNRATEVLGTGHIEDVDDDVDEDSSFSGINAGRNNLAKKLSRKEVKP
jgi:hypothetical protein